MSELLNHLKTPSKDTPLLIASWIQSSCGTVEEGEATACPPPKGRRGKKDATNTFGHAEKMRSSVSHYYAIDQERGNRQFMERADGSWSGNPSLSDFMAQYMKSLKRRKVSTDCTLFLIMCFKRLLLIIVF